MKSSRKPDLTRAFTLRYSEIVVSAVSAISIGEHMSTRVGELVSQLRSKSQVVTTNLGNVELIAEEGHPNHGMFRVDDMYLPWGDRNTQMVAGFLKGPGYKYLLRESLAWQRAVIKHHTDKLSDTPSIWYIEGNSIAGVYNEDAKIIPLVRVAEAISNIFDADDMANVLLGSDQVEINVLSDVKSVVVPGIEGVASRPLDGTVDSPRRLMKVGDLSSGGVRVLLYPGKPEKAPVVQELWERCFCTNQMTRLITGSQVNLRGRTVDAIIEEMENVARAVFEGLEASARAILHSAETPVPGAVSDYIRVVARENGINAASTLRLQERAASLQPNPSVYDVTQIFTELANEEGLPVVTRRALQAIGGNLTIDTERMVHRCNTCERPLAAA